MNKSSITEGHKIIHSQAVSADKVINNARQALEAGNREGAYQLSLEATQQESDNKEAWLIRARTAASAEERLVCLSQAVRIDPNYPIAKQVLYTSLKSELEQDPFLAYLNETGQLYFVQNEEYLSLVVPKDRDVPESYPPERPPALKKAYRRLSWSVLGLALAGVGTLIFAPLAFRQAVSALGQPLVQPDRLRARLVAWLSILLIVISLSLAWLLIIHVVG